MILPVFGLVWILWMRLDIPGEKSEWYKIEEHRTKQACQASRKALKDYHPSITYRCRDAAHPLN